MKKMELIAPCHFGLEAVLKREILDLGYEIAEVEDGRVTFYGDADAICRANIFLRTAERILLIGDLTGPCMFAVTMGISRIIFGKYGEQLDLMKFMSGSGILCVVCYLLAALSSSPIIGLIGCIACGFSVGIMWPGTISISSKTFPTGGTAMFSLLAMAGDLGGSIGPGIVGRITQNAGNNIRIGMGFGLIFPVILLFMLFLLYRKKSTQPQISKH